MSENQLMPKLKKVKSLGELACLAKTDTRYADLAIRSAANLGKTVADVAGAMRWLNINADETDEDGVIAEVNFCI